MYSLKNQFDIFEKRGVNIVSTDMNIIKWNDTKMKFEKASKYHPTKEQFSKGINTYFDPSCNSSYVPCGEKQGVIGIDIDNKDDTIRRWYDLVIKEKININTLSVLSINNGLHFYYRLTDIQKEKLKNFTSVVEKVFPGYSIDVKYNNGYIYGPSNVDYNGLILRYRVLNDSKVAILPDYIFNKCIEYLDKKSGKNANEIVVDPLLNMNIKPEPKWDHDNDLDFYLSCIPNHDDGQTRDIWLNIGLIIKNEGGDINKWIDWSNQCKKYGDQSRECLKTWDTFKEEKIKLGSLIMMAKQYINNVQKIRREKRPYDAYDLLVNGGEIGAARLFMTVNEENIFVTNPDTGACYMYEPKTKLWGEYDKAVMRLKLSDFLHVEYSKILERINKDGLCIRNPDKLKSHEEKRKEIVKMKTAVLKFRTINSIYQFVMGFNVDAKFVKKLNKIPYLLPIKNGKVLNLKTLEIRDRTRDDFFNFEMPVDFLGLDAKTPNADKFFVQIMNGDKSSAKYLRKCLGYCLTGETSSRCFFIFWGAGSNGKSSVFELMNEIMTDNFYAAVNKSVFIKRDRERSGATPELMKLIDKRLAVYSESERDEVLNEGMIKSLTGNDKMTARNLYQSKEVDFIPNIKPVMITNHKPILTTEDIAIVDRLKYIPFLARFTDNPKDDEFKKDVDFVKKLKTKHLSEVFTWMVKGAYEWYQDKKLVEPDTIKKATISYLDSLDSVGKFITDCCEKGGSKRVLKTDLHRAYGDYCADEGYKTVTKSEFYKKIKEKFREAKIDGYRFFIGLELSENN